MRKFDYNSRWGGVHGRKKTKTGFTLIEMIVAMFALGMIITIIGMVFPQALSFQRRALNAQKVEENLNLVMEAMAREIRVSTISTANTNCPSSPAASITLQHPVNGTVVYSLSGNALHRTVNGTDSIMSSNTVQFTQLQFCISGNTLGNQPRITILSSVQSADTNQQIKEDYQTTLSVRQISL